MMNEFKKVLKWLVCLIILGVYLTGCAPQYSNIPMPDDFLQTTGKRSIGLVWTSNANLAYPEGSEITGKHYQLGTQGLLDIIVARSFSDKLASELSKIRVNELMDLYYFKVFKPAFENINFVVKIKKEPYCCREYRMYDNEYCSNELPVKQIMVPKVGKSLPRDLMLSWEYDYAAVISELSVDYLLVLDFIRHGTGRTYFSAIPTSPPKGTTALVAYLVDGKKNEVISKYFSSVVEASQGEWDEPPEYPNLMEAVRKSFETAMDELFIEIFKSAP